MAAPAVSRASDNLLQRVRSEYMEMPGLHLTSRQAQRLWALDEATCAQILEQLVRLKFLVLKPDGKYARLSEGDTRFSKLRMTRVDIDDRSTRARSVIGLPESVLAALPSAARTLPPPK